VRKTDEMLEVARADNRSGFIAFAALAFPLLIVISFVPTIYHTIAKRRIPDLISKEDTKEDQPDLMG
jgi:hypothetical protein